MQCTPGDVQIVFDESNVFGYLRDLGLLGGTERAESEPAGDGNINWVRRVRGAEPTRSWILKQARPALERFPEYRVTTERLLFEARYYELTAPFDPQRVRPEILHFDAEGQMLAL